MIVFIGDAHGKIDRLLPIVDRYPADVPVFQLGDMGIGFNGVFLPHRGENFKWIRGNHDDPRPCREHSNYLGDYGVMEVEGRKMFYIAGAFSIDYKWRIPGHSWWEDEELSYTELDKAIALYEAEKPDLVISHECPAEIGRRMLEPLLIGKQAEYFGKKLDCCTSRTSGALQRMFEIHQPKDWVFGHYHTDQNLLVNGTHFHCCAELATYCLGEENILPSKSPLSEVSEHSDASILVAEVKCNQEI